MIFKKGSCFRGKGGTADQKNISRTAFSKVFQSKNRRRQKYNGELRQRGGGGTLSGKRGRAISRLQ